jgi:serine/threonine-protein kinase
MEVLERRLYSNGVARRDLGASDGTATSYRRVCELASGGMGEVELAIREEGRFRRLYAVKRLREGYRDDAEFREMFLEEARIAGLLRHPNAVSVLDVGEDARGPFLVMDYVEGTSVADIIARSEDEEVPLQIALRIVMDAAQGLHAAHELKDARGRSLGLVHRDVSPQNLLVGYDGVTRVTDFGIAKALGRTTHTATGVLKGKFGYLAPEQLRFDEPDRRSDVFSLGVVLFELLSGQRLYKNREGMDGAKRILNEPPPDIGEHRDDVPPELVALLFSMLAKDPAHRPSDALTVARTLEPIVAGLVELEGRAEVSDYVKNAFEAERIEKEERVSLAIAHATGTIVQLDGVGRTSHGASRGAPRLALVAALVAVLVALGAGAYFVASAGEAGASSMEEDADVAVSSPPPIGAAGEGQGAGPDELEAPASGAESALAGDEAGALEETEPVEGAAASMDPGATETRRRRVRRRRDMRAGGAAGGSGVPMWDWQP